MAKYLLIVTLIASVLIILGETRHNRYLIWAALALFLFIVGFLLWLLFFLVPAM